MAPSPRWGRRWASPLNGGNKWSHCFRTGFRNGGCHVMTGTAPLQPQCTIKSTHKIMPRDKFKNLHHAELHFFAFFQVTSCSMRPETTSYENCFREIPSLPDPAQIARRYFQKAHHPSRASLQASQIRPRTNTSLFPQQQGLYLIKSRKRRIPCWLQACHDNTAFYAFLQLTVFFFLELTTRAVRGIKLCQQ